MKKFFVSKVIFLSSAAALWLIVATILSDLTEDVLNSEQIINFDKYFAAIFLTWRSALGLKFFYIITFLANLEFVLPFAVIVLGFLIIKKYKTFIWPFIFTIASAELVTFIGKLLVRRIRPEAGALTMLDFSFPSGHATISMAMYGYLAYLLVRSTNKKTAHLAILLLAEVLIILIGFSRLYLGVHYVSDIVAGYLVGILALLAGISLREWLAFKSNQTPLPKSMLKSKLKK